MTEQLSWKLVAAILNRFPPKCPLAGCELVRYCNIIMANSECVRRIEMDMALYPIDPC